MSDAIICKIVENRQTILCKVSDKTQFVKLIVSALGVRGVSGPPGSGVPEAPLTGGPYGRDTGSWTPVMSPLLYDPAGVRSNCFDLAHQSGNLDGGIFT